MTPKQKALEIHARMFSAKGKDGFYTMTHETAKNCALVAVNEILNPNNDKLYRDVIFWESVKEEIQKL